MREMSCTNEGVVSSACWLLFIVLLLLVGLSSVHGYSLDTTEHSDTTNISENMDPDVDCHVHFYTNEDSPDVINPVASYTDWDCEGTSKAYTEWEWYTKSWFKHNEGIYDVAVFVGDKTSGNLQSYGNYECGVYQVFDVKQLWYDETQKYCENTAFPGTGGTTGRWDDSVPGELDIYEGNWTGNYDPDEWERPQAPPGEHGDFSKDPDSVQGSPGVCCGDDHGQNALGGETRKDNADWAGAFCYVCNTGDNKEAADSQGVAPRMWKEDEADKLDGGSAQDYRESHMCCGDDDSGNNATLADCAYMADDGDLCWEAQKSYHGDYSNLALGGSLGVTINDYKDNPAQDIQGEDYGNQWYWTDPSYITNKLIGVECENPHEGMPDIYQGQEIPLLAGDSIWHACDRSSFSLPGNIPSSITDSSSNLDHFQKDIENPYETSGVQYMCTIAELNGGTQGYDSDSTDLEPRVYECTDSGDAESAFTHNGEKFFTTNNPKAEPSDDTAFPYFGLYENEQEGAFDGDDFAMQKMSLQSFILPLASNKVSNNFFPRISSVDAMAFGRIDGAGGPVGGACSQPPCIAAVNGGTMWVYSTQGALNKIDTSDKFDTSSISALSYLNNKFGSLVENAAKESLVGHDGSSWFYYEGGAVEEESFTDIFKCDGGTPPDNPDWIVGLEDPYFDNVYPRILIQQGDTLYQLEQNASGGCYMSNSSASPADWNLDKNMMGGETLNSVDAVASLPEGAGSLGQFHVPAKSSAIVAVQGNSVYHLVSTPLHCIQQELWSSDYDNYYSGSGDGCSDTYKSTANAAGGEFTAGPTHYDSNNGKCCGEAEDLKETYMGSDGLCLLGEWLEPPEGFDFGDFKDGDDNDNNFEITTYTYTSSDNNDFREVYLQNQSAQPQPQLRTCALDDSESHCPSDSPGCENSLSTLGDYTKPYQGSSNYLYRGDFLNLNYWELKDEAATQGNQVEISSGGTTIRQYIHWIKPGRPYNFRVTVKRLAGSEPKNVTAYYCIKDTGADECSSPEESTTFTLFEKDEEYELVLPFMTPGGNMNSDDYDLSSDEHYVGLQFESSSSNYDVELVSASLSANEHLLDILEKSNPHGESTTGSADPLFDDVPDHDYCDAFDMGNDGEEDIYCSFREEWKEYQFNVSEDNITLKFLPEERWWNKSGENKYVPKGVQVAGCCPENYCWNGDECVSSDHDESRPTLYPNTSSRRGYRCLFGEWEWAEPKWEWDDDDERYGYCPNETQCLVDHKGNFSAIGAPQNYSHYAKYSAQGRNHNPMCIESGQYIKDHYCDGGNWTTRTSRMMKYLLELDVVSDGTSFTLYCDSPEKTHNVMHYPYTNLTVGPQQDPNHDCAATHEASSQKEYYVDNAYIFNDFTAGAQTDPNCLPDCYYRDTEASADDTLADRSYPCVNTFCFLSWKDNDKWKTIVSTTLNQELDAPNYPFTDLLGGSLTVPDESSFIDLELPNYDLAYRRHDKIVAFAPSSYSNNPLNGNDNWMASFYSDLLSTMKSFFHDDADAPVMFSPAPVQYNVSPELTKLYLADTSDDTISIEGGVSRGGVRNLPAEDLNDTEEQDGLMYSDTYIVYNNEYPDKLCMSLGKLDESGIEFDLGKYTCINLTDTTKAASHENEGEPFSDVLWRHITGELRPGR